MYVLWYCVDIGFNVALVVKRSPSQPSGSFFVRAKSAGVEEWLLKPFEFVA